jgi:hypothetical protein
MQRRLHPPAAAGERLGGIKPGTLAKWRHFGTGPEFVKIGNRVFYDETTLDTFVGQNRRRSTSEAAV